MVNQACEEARKKLTSTQPAGSSSAANPASIADRVVRSNVGGWRSLFMRSQFGNRIQGVALKIDPSRLTKKF